ncbi:uncharacterized protein LOC119836747 [Zerene cesonia]|uniref:uncharacterized protein LOC119836747 n=1 Tax=Zerene cesonia TaxID=33412 RepID=UPI0018E51C48|nr:uncharacterized protein LOC119836747 [Zerene cesonia]
MGDTYANNCNSKILGHIDFMEKQERYYFMKFTAGEMARLSILNDHVFRYYMSPSGEFLEYPKPMNPTDNAKIIHKEESSYGDAAFKRSTLHDTVTKYIVETKDINIIFDKITGTMKIHDLRTNGDVLIEYSSLSYVNNISKQTIYQRADEYFFGGGMQNGRFTHKGNVINITNTNNWVDGGVTSPCPFYWSTYGYGILRNTWQPGKYDFQENSNEIITTSHDGDDYDAYYFINSSPRNILRDYYELTGNPLLMPEYAYYEAHLNTFNRDYWVPVNCDVRGAILFEDGKYYKKYKPNEMDGKEGILESLNGEKNNYQFSARAMIDRYRRHDMPLGWFIPNDGYGSGYGQTDTLEGDIENLKEFSKYALEKGVKVALWTESNLEPADPLHPKKGERDLGKEISVAEVVALKCDVAWIGAGYSFALSAVENAHNIFVKNAKETARPMIIMVDGWAGTQRLAGIWSGDQRGGEWEYIRFHIPTYIGSGLSGMPIIGSDMDGIYAGGIKEINVRDFQWKTFTPLQLNMDGWGNKPKTPFIFDKEATSINRAYLKLKAMLMPYNYTLGYEAINGLPMVRAMFLEFPEDKSSYTNESKYQFMWGPNILVAPIFNGTCKDMCSIRNGVYLPNKDQVWIDFFTGERYQGGKIYNNLITPLWKIPVFIKDGSIIPMTKPNNNPREIQRDLRIITIYPNGESNFTVYEDDGVSSKYLEDQKAFTNIKVSSPKLNTNGSLLITINKTNGVYTNMTKERTTILQVMGCYNIGHIKTAINGEGIILDKVETEEEFGKNNNCYYLKKDFVVNIYMKEFSKDVLQECLLIKIKKLDVTSNEINIKISNYKNEATVFGQIVKIDKNIEIPQDFQVDEENTSLFCIEMKWSGVNYVQYYEIEKNGIIFTNIIGNKFTFDNLDFNSKHTFRIRAVNENVVSEWSPIVEGMTKDSIFKYIIAGVEEMFNHTCQSFQDSDDNNELKMNRQIFSGKVLSRNFDLGQVYDVDRAEFFESDDTTCSLSEIKYRCSQDNIEWTPSSDILKFHEISPKMITFDGLKFRYIEIIAINAESFGSGVIFYKK